MKTETAQTPAADEGRIEAPVMQHTPGPWYWHTDPQERASLRTPDRGNLIVMQFVRQGMQGAQPRFSHWRGMEEGKARERSGGIMTTGVDHPDARLIAAAPDLLAALEELMYARTDKAEKMARDAIFRATGAA